MGKQKDRYQAWSDAHINAWAIGDVDAVLNCYAENPVRTAVDPFGDHWTVRGRDALREIVESMSTNWSNRKVLKNGVLSANKKRGIIHTWVSWTSGDGKDMACSFVNIIHLDEHDKCTEYKEWNVVDERGDKSDDSDLVP